MQYLASDLLFGWSDAEFRRVCYFTNWSQYRSGAAKFLPENIDPTLCSHIIYAFAKLSGNQLTTIEWNDEDL
jgi:chitinase